MSEVKRLESLPGCSLLEIRILTGRTHQIRVHLSEEGHPLVGDRDYGAPQRSLRLLRDFARPALHARSLTFLHPESGVAVGFEAPLPEDFARLLDELRAIRDGKNNTRGADREMGR
jgi:23S rRNA-/tRNA-specific pseudouridylate synthase